MPLKCHATPSHKWPIVSFLFIVTEINVSLKRAVQGVQGLLYTGGYGRFRGEWVKNSGLCSSRARWSLGPNFCSRATRKSSFFIQIICWAPLILQFQSTGLPSIFLRTQPWNCIVLTLLTFFFYRKFLFRSVSD